MPSRTSRSEQDPRRSKREDDKDKKKKEEPNINDLAENDLDMEIDFEKLVQKEYGKLQRQYRIMEDVRHAALAGAGKAIGKQERLVDLLRASRLDLETDLYNAESAGWRRLDKTSKASVLSILENLEKALREQEYCLKNIREIESYVTKIKKEIIAYQLKVQNLFGESLTAPMADRRNKILENRLYLARTRCDTKVSANKAIREEINMMLKLRGLFFERHNALKRHLARIKAHMAVVVFHATETYDERDELVNSMNNLREKNDKDTRQHVIEIKEFHRILHNDAKARTFNTLKNMDRRTLESSHDRNARRNSARLDEMDDAIIDYAINFKMVLKASKFETIESLMKHYREIEQENFVRFMVIVDMNHEFSLVMDDSDGMCRDIEDRFNASVELEEFEAQTHETEGEWTEKKQDELAQVSRLLQITEHNMKGILAAMEALVKGTGCSEIGILRMLGNGQPLRVTPRNAILYMQSIETRGRDLQMEVQGWQLRKTIELRGVSFLRATTPKPTPAPLKGKHAGGPFGPDVIVGGQLEGDDDDEKVDDHGIHVLSTAEFRIKVIWKIEMRRELQAQATKLIMSRALERSSIALERSSVAVERFPIDAERFPIDAERFSLTTTV